MVLDAIQVSPARDGEGVEVFSYQVVLSSACYGCNLSTIHLIRTCTCVGLEGQYHYDQNFENSKAEPKKRKITIKMLTDQGFTSIYFKEPNFPKWGKKPKDTKYYVSVSGGGLRAFASHMAAFRVLSDSSRNTLSTVDMFSTISGGSWFMARLAYDSDFARKVLHNDTHIAEVVQWWLESHYFPLFRKAGFELERKKRLLEDKERGLQMFVTKMVQQFPHFIQMAVGNVVMAAEYFDFCWQKMVEHFFVGHEISNKALKDGAIADETRNFFKNQFLLAFNWNQLHQWDSDIGKSGEEEKKLWFLKKKNTAAKSGSEYVQYPVLASAICTFETSKTSVPIKVEVRAQGQSMKKLFEVCWQKKPEDYLHATKYTDKDYKTLFTLVSVLCTASALMNIMWFVKMFFYEDEDPRELLRQINFTARLGILLIFYWWLIDELPIDNELVCSVVINVVVLVLLAVVLEFMRLIHTGEYNQCSCKRAKKLRENIVALSWFVIAPVFCAQITADTLGNEYVMSKPGSTFSYTYFRTVFNNAFSYTGVHCCMFQVLLLLEHGGYAKIAEFLEYIALQQLVLVTQAYSVSETPFEYNRNCVFISAVCCVVAEVLTALGKYCKMWTININPFSIVLLVQVSKLIYDSHLDPGLDIFHILFAILLLIALHWVVEYNLYKWGSRIATQPTGMYGRSKMEHGDAEAQACGYCRRLFVNVMRLAPTIVSIYFLIPSSLERWIIDIRWFYNFGCVGVTALYSTASFTFIKRKERKQLGQKEGKLERKKEKEDEEEEVEHHHCWTRYWDKFSKVLGDWSTSQRIALFGTVYIAFLLSFMVKGIFDHWEKQTPSHHDCNFTFAFDGLTIGQVTSASSAAVGAVRFEPWLQNLIELIRSQTPHCGAVSVLLREQFASPYVVQEFLKVVGCRKENSALTAERWSNFFEQMAVKMNITNGSTSFQHEIAVDSVIYHTSYTITRKLLSTSRVLVLQRPHSKSRVIRS